MPDAISLCALAAIIITLLSVPLIAIKMGSSFRADAADEAEKRHVAESKLQEQKLADITAIAAQRLDIIKDLEQQMKESIHDTTDASKKAIERAKELSSGDNPDDIAHRLLQRAGNSHSNPVSTSSPGPAESK